MYLTLLCVCLSYEAMQCTEPSLSMQTTPSGNGCAIQHSSVPVPIQDKFWVLRQEWHLAYNGGDGGGAGTYDPNELTSNCIVSVDASVSLTCFEQNWKYARFWRSWYYSRTQFPTWFWWVSAVSLPCHCLWPTARQEHGIRLPTSWFCHLLSGTSFPILPLNVVVVLLLQIDSPMPCLLCHHATT